MTCVVGFIEKNNVIIGTDTAASTDSIIGNIQNISSKIFVKSKCHFNFLFGYTTSFRMGQIMKYEFEIPNLDKIKFKNEYCETNDVLIENYVVNDFINNLREILKEKGFTEICNNAESGGSFLLGITSEKNQIKPRLFCIQNDFSAIEDNEGFYAIGSGQEFSLGALKALKNSKLKFSGQKTVKLALMSASECSPYVREPFEIMKI